MKRKSRWKVCEIARAIRGVQDAGLGISHAEITDEKLSVIIGNHRFDDNDSKSGDDDLAYS